MELKALKNLLEALRKYGVTKYKTSEFEIELEASPSKDTVLKSIQKSNKEATIVPSKEEISDEDMLFWSVPPLQSDDEKKTQ